MPIYEKSSLILVLFCFCCLIQGNSWILGNWKRIVGIECIVDYNSFSLQKELQSFLVSVILNVILFCLLPAVWGLLRTSQSLPVDSRSVIINHFIFKLCLFSMNKAYFSLSPFWIYFSQWYPQDSPTPRISQVKGSLPLLSSTSNKMLLNFISYNLHYMSKKLFHFLSIYLNAVEEELGKDDLLSLWSFLLWNCNASGYLLFLEKNACKSFVLVKMPHLDLGSTYEYNGIFTPLISLHYIKKVIG